MDDLRRAKISFIEVKLSSELGRKIKKSNTIPQTHIFIKREGKWRTQMLIGKQPANRLKTIINQFKDDT